MPPIQTHTRSMLPHSRFPYSLILGSLLAFAACGGSSGSSAHTPPSGLAYAHASAIYARGVAIEANLPTVQGKVAAYTIVPALPSGLALDSKTGAISGTPTTVTPLASYVVHASNAGGETTFELSLGVQPPTRFAVVASSLDETLSTYTVDAATGSLSARSYAVRTHGETSGHEVIAHPNGKTVYVVDAGSNDIGVYSLDAATGAITETALVATDPEPTAFLIDPTGNYAFALCKQSSTLIAYLIDPKTGVPTAVGAPLFVAGAPQALALRPDGHVLYVAQSGLSQIQAYSYDASTHLLAPIGASQPTGKSPVALAIDPSGRYLYSADLRAAGMSLFQLDVGTGAPQLLGTVATGAYPADVVIDPTGRFLYVAVSGTDSILGFALQSNNGSLSSVGPAYSAGQRPIAIRFDSTGSHLYALDIDGNAVWTFTVDTDTGTLSQAEPTLTRDMPISIVGVNGDTPATPRPKFAYVGNNGSSDISTYSANPDSGVLTSVSPSVFANGKPQALVASSDGRFVYSLNATPNALHTFDVDAATGDLHENLASVPLGLNPTEGVIEPSGRFLYATNSDSDQLATFALDATTGAPTAIATTPTDVRPIAAACDTTGRFIFVANYTGNTIATYRIDPTGGALTAVGTAFAVAGRPRALMCHPSGRFLYVVLEQGSAIVRLAIDPASGALGSPLAQSTGLQPNSIAIEPHGRFAYTVDANPSSTGQLSYYSINSASGNLSPLGTAAAQVTPVAVACDPSGRFLYVVNHGTDAVAIYGLQQQTGKPTSTISISTGVMPIGIALINSLE